MNGLDQSGNVADPAAWLDANPEAPRWLRELVASLLPDSIELADGRIVPEAAVKALDVLERVWPGATFPQARPAIVAAVLDAIS